MPLIKDKYGAKGAQTRSKFVTRSKNRAIVTESISPSVQTTAQKQEEQNKITKEIITPTSVTAKKSQSVSGVKLSVINEIEIIASLNSGERLEDIIFSHYATNSVTGVLASSIISIYWSALPISDLSFSVSAGEVKSPGPAYRLLTSAIPAYTTVSLRNSGAINKFDNINKTIYFYAACSVLGPEFTIIKS